MGKSIIQNAIELRDPALAKRALLEIDLLLEASLDPNERTYLLFSRASCYGILGNFRRAEQEIALALQQNSDNPDTRLACDLNTALLYQQQGKYEEAFERLSAMLATYAESLKRPELRFVYEDIQQRRAFLSVTSRRFQEAILLLKEILSFGIEKQVRSDALARLGLCYLELQEWSLAKKYLLEAESLGLSAEEEKTFHFYLGIAYFHTDDLARARGEFKTCEQHATEYSLPILDIYGWLSVVSKGLGEVAESDRYSRLAKSN